MTVDPWSASYGVAFEMPEDGPAERSAAAVDTDIEMPADEWRPIVPPGRTVAPGVVAFIDGVRRVDANLWLDDDDANSYPGIAASFGSGVVRCDRSARTAEVVTPTVERGIFTYATGLAPIGTPPARYNAFSIARHGPNALVNAVQAKMTAIEKALSETAAPTVDLLVADGPLRGRVHSAHMIGYVKTHHSQYLPDRLTAVVTGLHPGQRSPIFTIESQWPLHSWYLRLPGPAGSAWAGIVRIECTGELATDAAVALADVSAATLPGFASTPYKDARAPQNLVPIAGLEKRLRGLLGDPRLLHRTLLRHASSPTAGAVPAASSAPAASSTPAGVPA
jgi:hypothetical protein